MLFIQTARASNLQYMLNQDFRIENKELCDWVEDKNVVVR